MDRSALSYWESGHAGPVRPMGEPIVPTPQDIAFVEAELPAGASCPPVTALLLGTTRALAAMRWPIGTTLAAIEWSGAMIHRFWPPEGVPASASMVRADWRELPLAAASCDVVVGDGCYSVLATVKDAELLNAEVRRVLRPGGVFCMRCFARPARGLSVGDVFDKLRSGRIGNAFLLQWLLAMAIHGDTQEGVVLDTVWRAWSAEVPKPRELFAGLGWPDSSWSFDRWKGVRVRYSFPTLDELRALGAQIFSEVRYRVPDYPWGECFPSLVMRP
jgi:SAM-dependent methyltransferase